MINKNKYWVLFLVLILSITFVGCGSDSNNMQEKYSVSGIVYDEQENELSDVKLKFDGVSDKNSNNDFGTATTDDEGKFTKTGLIGEVKITLVKEGYSFSSKKVTESTEVIFESKAVTNEAPEPPSGGPGVIYGEPHFITVDGLAYDYQGVGEYYAVVHNSKPDFFAVQARFEKAVTNASMATSCAMKVAEDVVEVTKAGIVYVNKEAANIPISGPLNLEGGGRIFKEDRKTIVVWPENQIQVHVVGTTIRVYLEESYQDEISGLLGNFDGKQDNDLIAQDGTSISFDPTFEELYETYGDSWRITQEESLFNYKEGENTETYTDLDFPEKIVRVEDIPSTEYIDIKEQVEDAGIDDPVLIEELILDIYLTGDQSFIDDYLAIEGVRKEVTDIDETISPTVDFNTDNSGLKLTITGSANDKDGSVSEVKIDWGDGNITTVNNGFASINESHIYDSEGVYEIKINTTDNNGNRTFRNMDVTVREGDIVYQNFSNDYFEIDHPQTWELKINDNDYGVYLFAAQTQEQEIMMVNMSYKFTLIVETNFSRISSQEDMYQAADQWYNKNPAVKNIISKERVTFKNHAAYKIVHMSNIDNDKDVDYIIFREENSSVNLISFGADQSNFEEKSNIMERMFESFQLTNEVYDLEDYPY